MTKKETTKEIVPFDIETAVIVALDTKYKDIQITDGKSYARVMAGIADYRDLRLSVIAGHKKEKHDVLEHCNFLDAEKRRILARLAPGEDKLKAIRQAWDDEKEKVEAEKVRIEEERKQNILAEIYAIQAWKTGTHLMALDALRELSDRLEKIEITEAEYMEFKDTATEALDDTYNTVQDAIATRIKLDKEEVARKAEDARLEKVRKEQAEAQTKIDEENRKIQEEKDKLEAEKKAEQEKKELDEQMKELKAQVEQDTKDKAEQKRRDALEKEEADKAEKARQEALRPDKEKLVSFANDILDIPNMRSFSTKKAQEIAGWAIGQLSKLSDEIKAKAEEL